MTESESLERAIHEDVGLSPYDPGWMSLFDDECRRLRALFPSDLLQVEHIGSTAIPGMAAKPIVDILGGVASMLIADALVEPLLATGYVTSPEFNATLHDRRWFMRHVNGSRTHHLHVVCLGEREWRRRLHFRDALRANATLAREYADMKAALAATFRADREAYTDAKSSFVLSVSGNA